MRSSVSRFLSVASMVLAISLGAGAVAVAQPAVFEGNYNIGFSAEMGTTTIKINPAMAQMILEIPAGSNLFFNPGPQMLTLAATPVAGGTQYQTAIPPAGTLTIVIFDNGNVTAAGVDIPGFAPGPVFNGTGTITDPTLFAPVNTISLNFLSDPAQGPVPPPQNMGSLTANVTAPLPGPVPTLPWPVLMMLALLLAVFGIWRTRQRPLTPA